MYGGVTTGALPSATGRRSWEQYTSEAPRSRQDAGTKNSLRNYNMAVQPCLDVSVSIMSSPPHRRETVAVRCNILQVVCAIPSTYVDQLVAGIVMWPVSHPPLLRTYE